MGDASAPPRVLVVDDEEGYRALLTWKLGARGLRVEAVKDGGEALVHLADSPVDLVITDLTMPHADGLKLLEEIKRRWPQTAVIIITGFGTIETAVQAIKLGALDVVIKPFDLGPFIDLVMKAVSHRATMT